MKYTFYGQIKDGKIVLDNQSLCTEAISCIRDMRIDLIIKTAGKDVNLEQWGYLYGSVYKIFAEHYGWSIDDVDSYFKKKFMLEKGIILPKGIVLTKACFEKEGLSTYVDCCIRFCAEEGIVVPPANKQWRKEEARTDEKNG